MKNSFLDIIRTPDDVKIYTENSPFRFEEPGEANDTRADVKCTVEQMIDYLKLQLRDVLPDNQTLLWCRG